ncbi:prolyl-tRNA synthetase associated domain-containing protein [Sphingosinicellaceae bacterium]|nr:prolyl-tRNA synthetase associated domain-containing protein [Sphingosinicellaceae bacterium]
MADEQALIADLRALGIDLVQVEHPAVFTVDESAGLHDTMPGLHTKNLFLKDAGGRFWLVTVPAEARVDLKALPAVIGAKKVSFGKADDMVALLGVTPGAVTPLAAINDEGRAVTVVLDAAVAGASRVNVHPLRNTSTIGLSGADLVRALTHWRHTPVVATIPTVLPAS